jgi:hypothetical protein
MRRMPLPVLRNPLLMRGNSLLARMQTVRLHRPHPQYRLAE